MSEKHKRYIEGERDTEILELLEDAIQFSRIEILSETGTAYFIRYGSRNLEIMKGESSYFNHASSGISASFSMEMRQIMPIDTTIFQDCNVPPEFREVMIFHEIREQEYNFADFEDAHERAVLDERLYVMKYFSEEEIIKYLEFSKKYRDEEKAKQMLLEEKQQKKEEEEERRRIMEITRKKLEREKLLEEREEERRKDELRTKKFWENHPNLKSFVENAKDIHYELSDGFKKHVSDRLTGFMNHWDKEVLSSEESTESFIAYVKKYIKKKKAKPTFGHYLNGWRKRGDKYVYKEKDAIGRIEKIECALKTGLYYDFTKHKEVELTVSEIKFLESLLELFYEVEDRFQNDEITRESLQILYMKANALYGRDDFVIYFDFDEYPNKFKYERFVFFRKERECTKAKKQAFHKRHPDLRPYIDQALQRKAQVDHRAMDSMIYHILPVIFSFNILHLKSNAEFLEFINSLYLGAAERRDRSVIGYINEWNERDAHSIKEGNSNNLKILKRIIKSGIVYRGGKEIVLSDVEKEHLQEVIELCEDFEKKCKEKVITKDVLYDFYLKYKALQFKDCDDLIFFDTNRFEDKRYDNLWF